MSKTSIVRKKVPFKVGNFDVALKVLQRIKREKFLEELFYVKAYCNGREQGLCIVGWTGRSEFRASFSENRNSDDIVVYSETMDYPDNRDRDDQWSETNVPGEAAYAQARYFNWKEYDRAAQHIIAQMHEYENRAALEFKQMGI